jgi:hypothetical protein
MSQPSIAAQVHEPFNIHGHFSPQITLDFVIGVNSLPDPCDLVIGQFVRLGAEFHTRFGQDGLGTRAADTINISQGDFYPLVPR